MSSLDDGSPYESQMLEKCCVCAFLHRVGEVKSTRAVPHFHWCVHTPGSCSGSCEPLVFSDFDIWQPVRTVCVAHIRDGHILFAEARGSMAKKYRVHGRLNAPLPREYLTDDVISHLNYLHTTTVVEGATPRYQPWSVIN
jgi:hypothetical protein